MDELLKEAIADAKAVRETALANAKLALEEAFTPRLKSMLSKKIQSEMEDAVDELDIDELEEEDEEDKDDMEERGNYMSRDGDEMDDKDEEDDDDDMEERMKDMSRHGDEMDDKEDDMEEIMKDDDEDMDEAEVIEINGVKYAPISEDDEVEERMKDDDDDMEERMKDDDDDMDEDLDLDEILKELEEEDSVDEAEEVEEAAEEVDESEEIDENDVSSGIGKGDNSHDKKSGSSTEIGKADKAKMKESVEEVDEAEEVEESEEVEEDIDLEEVIKALSEDEEVEESTEKVESLTSELAEHRKVVKYLREKLNEVNLLNAKLLFTNKLFRAFGMNNEQKMKVVETFDRAKTLREIKLVYATVAENFSNENIKPIKESKGSASKAVASTKSEKQEIISEGTDMKQRFQKLANIL
jgi:sulfur relay (sulfurtransferase) DsrC/TusE family protein